MYLVDPRITSSGPLTRCATGTGWTLYKVILTMEVSEYSYGMG